MMVNKAQISLFIAIMLIAPLYVFSLNVSQKNDLNNYKSHSANHKIDLANSNTGINKYNNLNGVLTQNLNENSVNIGYNNENHNDLNVLSSLSSEEQIKLMSKQLYALTQHRKEDYQLLEKSLQKYMKTNLLSLVDEDIRTELEKLR